MEELISVKNVPSRLKDAFIPSQAITLIFCLSYRTKTCEGVSLSDANDMINISNNNNDNNNNNNNNNSSSSRSNGNITKIYTALIREKKFKSAFSKYLKLS